MIMLQASVCMSLNLSPSVHLQSVPVLASVLLLMAMLPSARPNLWEVWQVIIATLASIWLAVVSDTAKKVEVGIKRNHFAKVSIFFRNSALKNLICLPPAPPPSVVTCPQQSIMNGRVSYSEASVGRGETEFGASVIYTCNDGYILQGFFSRECLYNATWSGLAPVCGEPS